METKIINGHPRYEISTDGKYRMIGKQDWLSGCGSDYCRATLDKASYSLHRLVWKEFKGDIPQGNEIDHINSNKKDNRLENLRCVSINENRKFSQQKPNHKLREISKNAHQMKKQIKATNITNNEEKIFTCKTQAAKYYGCSPSLVYLICEQKNNAKTFGGTIKFKYFPDHVETTDITIVQHGRLGKKMTKKYNTKAQKEKDLLANQRIKELELIERMP